MSESNAKGWARGKVRMGPVMSPQKLSTAQHSQQHLLVPHLRSTNPRAQFTARFWKQVIELLQGLLRVVAHWHLCAYTPSCWRSCTPCLQPRTTASEEMDYGLRKLFPPITCSSPTYSITASKAISIFRSPSPYRFIYSTIHTWGALLGARKQANMLHANLKPSKEPTSAALSTFKA